MGDPQDRRLFLQSIGCALAGGLLLVGSAARPEDKDEDKAKDQEETPVEDLSKEHGLLNRILLIYDESERRLTSGTDFDVKHVEDSAGIIRKFIEEYHEKQEEDFLFPRFQKANKLTDLVAVLKQQHDAGRQVTAHILQLASGPAAKKGSPERQKLAERLHAFARMYRPHEAREDTVLFPELKKIVSAHEYDAMGEEFEKRERQMFGGDGFETMLDKVAQIEKALGIYDLNQFTPR